MTPNLTSNPINPTTPSINPYLNNPELNYNIDKAKRNYMDLSLRYNIVEWDDLMKNPLPVDENDDSFTIANPPTEAPLTNNFPFSESTADTYLPETTELSQSLINTTLANLKPIQSQPVDESIHYHTSSPEISSSPDLQISNESSSETRVENKVEQTPESNKPKELEINPKQKEPESIKSNKLSAEVISSMIGKFNVYGYAPSATVLNKLIRSKKPQTAWKVFPTSSAKSWLYALAGRLIAIHNSNGDFDSK